MAAAVSTRGVQMAFSRVSRVSWSTLLNIIHSPEQKPPDVVAYPWTIRADDELCQILDLTSTNPYEAIDVGTELTREHVRHDGDSTLVLPCP